MKIRTGKEPSIKDILDGKTKIDKEDAVKNSPLQVTGIVTGISQDFGRFCYLLIEDDKYVAIPAANLDEFAAYAEDAEAKAEFESKKYAATYEKSTSRNGKDYFTCYVDLIEK